MNKIEVVIIGVKKFDFKDERSGRQVQGTNVFYHPTIQEMDDTTSGFVPTKSTLPLDMFTKLSRMEFPHLCETVIEQSLGSKGVISKVVDFKPVKKFEYK